MPMKQGTAFVPYLMESPIEHLQSKACSKKIRKTGSVFVYGEHVYEQKKTDGWGMQIAYPVSASMAPVSHALTAAKGWTFEKDLFLLVVLFYARRIGNVGCLCLVKRCEYTDDAGLPCARVCLRCILDHFVERMEDWAQTVCLCGFWSKCRKNRAGPHGPDLVAMA